MGSRGPQKSPRQAHKLRGTLREDRHAGPEMPVMVPQMPPDLGPVAQGAWNVITAKLLSAGLIADLDQLPMRLLCESVELYLEACDVVKRDGLIVASVKAIYQHPAVGIRNKAWAQIVKLCREFGMSPSARCGLHIDTKQGQGKGVADILGLHVA
ncbi:MAG: phage terminase small subunit P27 family [Elusimicrobia bacterium]|nr:phage terminase small subunit P27 family [Elusimicrobiota bacterium]